MSAVPTEVLPKRAAIDGAVYIPLNLLAASPTNPRKHFDPKKLAELAENIKKHGVLQPVLVRERPGAKAGQPLYEIVAGERRWRASQAAKTEFVPAIVREMNDFEVLELQLIENLQRDDLHPMEEAEGYKSLMSMHGGAHYANVDELAARIGKSRSYVFGRMKLCALTETAKKAFLEGQINASTALLIARMPATIQVDATKKILQGWGGEPASYRQARDLLEREFMLKLGSAPFKITDANLVPAAGSCKDCGKRTGANPDLFDDIKSGDVCTDPPCFAKKKDAHQANVIAEAKGAGREVITGAEAKKAMPHEYGDLKDYVKLDAGAHHLGIYSGNGKTVGQLMGKQAPTVILLESPHSKELIEVVRRADAVKILKDKGVIKPQPSSAHSDAEKKRQAKARAETAWRTEVATRAITAIADKKFDANKSRDWLMPVIAMAMWLRLEHEVEKRAEKLLGWEHIDVGYNGNRIAGAAKAEARFRKLTAAQLDQAFVAMALAGETVASPYSTAKPERLLSIAKGLRVDVDKVKAELAAAAKAKVKKPAAKKAVAKKPTAVKRASTAVQKTRQKPPAVKKAVTKKAAPARPSKVVMKYRSPATGETWSGRGLQPAWLKAALKAGKTLADFETAAKAPATDAAPIAVKNGTTVEPAKAWPFPTDGTPPDPFTRIQGGEITRVERFAVGDRAKVKFTATGRKTAKDQREGKIAEILPDKRVVLRWGDKAHEKGVYDAAELERVGLDPKTAWPFPTGPKA